MKQKLRNLGIAAGGALLGMAAIINTDRMETSEAAVSEVKDLDSQTTQIQDTRRKTEKKVKKVVRNLTNNEPEKVKVTQEQEDEFSNKLAPVLERKFAENGYDDVQLKKGETPEGIKFSYIKLSFGPMGNFYVSLSDYASVDEEHKFSVVLQGPKGVKIEITGDTEEEIFTKIGQAINI